MLGIVLLLGMCALSRVGSGNETTLQAQTVALSGSVDAARALPTVVVTVTASDLAKAYERNEAAAQHDYGGKIVEISGVVRAIQLDLGDEPRVALAVPGQISPINVTFDKGGNSSGIEALEKGKIATFRCTNVGEILGSPYVEGCRVWK